ncbi:hypothetical protein [Rhizobium rhizogenes]|uniref:hypothetical protein n=1 Tax=Rhizobium rhizogenes TaxID=359 RepID=UPI00122F748A|nr:hypothetical protein [Rhizobium rhizogenes]
MLKEGALSFEERIARQRKPFRFSRRYCSRLRETVYRFREDYLGVVDFTPQKVLPDRLCRKRRFVKDAKTTSRSLYVVQEDIPNLFLPHYLRKKR